MTCLGMYSFVKEIEIQSAFINVREPLLYKQGTQALKGGWRSEIVYDSHKHYLHQYKLAIGISYQAFYSTLCKVVYRLWIFKCNYNFIIAAVHTESS